MTVGEFATRLAMVASVVPCSVTSWGRSAAHNAAVGGHPDSWHRLWLGADVVLDDPRDRPLFERQCVRLGLRVVDEGNHLHVQPGLET